MTPGVAGYPGQFGNVLIKKESFDKFINTMVGVPVIINHKDITAKNANDERVGVVSNVWFDDKDGWYWCDGVIWDETAQNLITDKGWSVSCSYDVKLADDAGGTENNIPYDIEFLDGVFTHLAIVDNPRYERANIVFNSKTIVKNATEDAQGNLHSERNGQFVSKGDSSTRANHPQNIDTSKLLPVDFTQDDIDRFKEHGSVQKYYREHILGTDITHPDERLGKIYFDDDGLGESKNINRPKNFYLIAKAPELVKSALYDRAEPATKHERNDKIVKFHLLYAKAKINTKFGSKTKLLQIKIAEDNTGKKYYFLRPVATEINSLTNSAIAKDVNNDNSSLLNSETNIIITDIPENFNPGAPNMKKHEVQNHKENTEMALIDELKKLITKVENDKGEDMDDNKEKIENEKVDKRKLIDEVTGIMKSAGADDEKIRTAIAKMEKLAYDKSEAGTADNEKEDEPKDDKPADNSKVKNESEEDNKKYEDLKKETKEDVENKCKNSVDNSKGSYFDKMNEIYNSAIPPAKENTYISRADRLEAGKSY